MALSVYILIQSGYTLFAGVRPHTSPAGVVWLALRCVATLAFAFGKHRTGRALVNPVLRSESRVTLVDGALAAAVLLGLVVNAVAGWWFADPVAGLVIVFYGVKEGLQAWRTD